MSMWDFFITSISHILSMYISAIVSGCLYKQVTTYSRVYTIHMLLGDVC